MRDNNKFKIPLVNTNAKKFNITYYGLICWNNLLIHLKSYNSLVTLKTEKTINPGYIYIYRLE